MTFTSKLTGIAFPSCSSSYQQPAAPLSEKVKMISNDLFEGKQEDDLFFVMERFGETNGDFWIKFLSKENKLAARSFKKCSDKTLQNLVTGTTGSVESLKTHLLVRDCIPHELWILYASVKSVSDGTPFSSDNIEMTCTVSTTPDAPFVNHMGIARTMRFAAYEIDTIRTHSNISMNLHSFGAKVMKIRYPEKIYMITTPMPIMEEIFIKSLGKERVYIGFDADWITYVQTCREEIEQLSNEIQRLENHLLTYPEDIVAQTRLDETIVAMVRPTHQLEYYQKKIDSCGATPRLSMGSKYSSFELNDLEGNRILSLNEDQMRTKYEWYFDNSPNLSCVNTMVAIPLDVLADYTKPSPSNPIF